MKLTTFIGVGTVQIVFAIVATGVLLNFANSGTLGETAKKFSKYVTEGYGAGAIT